MTTPEPKDKPSDAVPRQPNGPSTFEMLLSRVDGVTEDDFELSEELWYASGEMVGPSDTQDSDPEKPTAYGAPDA